MGSMLVMRRVVMKSLKTAGGGIVAAGPVVRAGDVAEPCGPAILALLTWDSLRGSLRGLWGVWGVQRSRLSLFGSRNGVPSRHSHRRPQTAPCAPRSGQDYATHTFPTKCLWSVGFS